MPDVRYVSRLAKLAVLEPEGGTVGRIEDAVVGPATTTRSPQLLGLVVVVPGRRIFVAAGRVAEIDGDGVRLATGQVNVRRFARRPSERLVLGDIVGTEVGRDLIADVGLRPSESRRVGWEVATVALLPVGRVRRRRTRPRVVDWTEAAAAFAGVRDEWAHLRERHAAEVADQLELLDAKARLRVAESLDDDQLADVLEKMDDEVSADVVEALGLERAADVLEAMEPDEAADLLGEVALAQRSVLLAAMEPGEAAPVRRLLSYGPDSAGGLMTPEPLILPARTTVAEALALLRNADLQPALAGRVYVTEAPNETPTGAYRGSVGFQRLVSEPPWRRLAECLEQLPEPVPPSLPGAEVVERLADYDVLALPVVDDAGRLVGAVTTGDVLGWAVDTARGAGPRREGARR